MDSLRLTPEFESRLLPYLQRQLEEHKEGFTDEQKQYLQKCLAELKARPTPQAPKGKRRLEFDKSGASLSDVFTKRPDFFDLPPRYRSELDSRSGVEYGGDINPTRAVIFCGLSIIAFMPGLIFFRRDLPAAATLGTIITSRLLLLTMDVGFFLIMFRSLFRDSSFKSTFDTTEPLRLSLIREGSRIATALMVIGAAYFAHTRYIGPLNQQNQALQFLINLPAMLLSHYGLKRD